MYQEPSPLVVFHGQRIGLTWHAQSSCAWQACKRIPCFQPSHRQRIGLTCHAQSSCAHLAAQRPSCLAGCFQQPVYTCQLLPASAATAGHCIQDLHAVQTSSCSCCQLLWQQQHQASQYVSVSGSAHVSCCQLLWQPQHLAYKSSRQYK